MRLRHLVIAQHIIEHDHGMTSMLNAGWSTLNLPGPGAAYMINLALQVEVTSQEAGTSPVLVIDLISPSGNPISRSSSIISTPPERLPDEIVTTSTVVLHLPTQFDEAGRYRLRVEGVDEPFETVFAVTWS